MRLQSLIRKLHSFAFLDDLSFFVVVYCLITVIYVLQCVRERRNSPVMLFERFWHGNTKTGGSKRLPTRTEVKVRLYMFLAARLAHSLNSGPQTGRS